MEKKIVVESLEEMERLEAEGIIKPTEWDRIAMTLIEANRCCDRIQKVLDRPWWKFWASDLTRQNADE